MGIYQHDSATTFRFVIRDELSGTAVRDLEHAWTTAKSVLNQKQLVVDLSGVTNADALGMDLLLRMRESGARLIAALPPRSRAFLDAIGIAAPAPDRRCGKLARLVRPWLSRRRSGLSQEPTGNA